jgi:hypothetical protein
MPFFIFVFKDFTTIADEKELETTLLLSFGTFSFWILAPSIEK